MSNIVNEHDTKKLIMENLFFHFIFLAIAALAVFPQSGCSHQDKWPIFPYLSTYLHREPARNHYLHKDVQYIQFKVI